MSDIVEMLVDAAGGNEAHVCAIAAAEIKRNLSQIEQLDARCGRLRDTCSTWERASNNYAEAVEIKDAEIERLRGENLARGNALGRIAVALFGDQNNRTDEECVAAAAEVGYGLAGCREKVARQAEEIERLRADVVHWREARRMCIAAGDMMKAEIERLRQQVTQRGARMQLMREWMLPNDWMHFVITKPEAVEWFDDDGVPR